MKIVVVETNGMKCKFCGVFVPFNEYSLICPCCFARSIEAIRKLRILSDNLHMSAKLTSQFFEKDNED